MITKCIFHQLYVDIGQRKLLPLQYFQNNYFINIYIGIILIIIWNKKQNADSTEMEHFRLVVEQEAAALFSI